MSHLILVLVSQSVTVKQEVQMHPWFPSLETSGPEMSLQKHEEHGLRLQSISYKGMNKNQMFHFVY